MRKRIVLLSVIAASCFFFTVDAHSFTIEKGTISLGGSSDMSLGRDDSDRGGDVDHFQASLESGYFVMDNLETDGTTWSLGAGWEYFFNRYVAATIGLDYTETDWDAEREINDGIVSGVLTTDDSYTSFGLNFGLRVYFR